MRELGNPFVVEVDGGKTRLRLLTALGEDDKVLDGLQFVFDRIEKEEEILVDEQDPVFRKGCR